MLYTVVYTRDENVQTLYINQAPLTAVLVLTFRPLPPSPFALMLLPPFYKAVFDARRPLGGSCDPSYEAPAYSGGSNFRTLLSGITYKLAYLRLLEINAVVPHCVEKFSPSFG